MSDPVQSLLRDNSARVISRSPVNRRQMWSGIKLGMALEVELASGCVIRWKRDKPQLFWNRAGRYLGLADGWGKPGRKPSSEDDALFHGFHGRDAKATLAWEGRAIIERWISLGGIERIDYFSTKHGERKSYTHDHGRGVKLYRFGGPSRCVWVVKGGSLTVTARGIVN